MEAVICQAEMLSHPWEYALLPLSVRAYRVLHSVSDWKRRRLVTVADVCSLSESDLMKTRNCGIKTVHEIQKALHQYGLRLGCHYQSTDWYWGA